MCNIRIIADLTGIVKRKENMASIQKRGDNYRIVVSMGYDINGKKLVEITTFTPDKDLTPKKQQKAVEEFAYEFEKKCRNHERLEGEKTTLQEFIARWTAEKAQQELQPGTLEKYQAVIDSFILPALGHLKLSEIKPHTVNFFFVSMTKDGCRHDGKPGGYSKGTINKVSNVLSSILRTAVEWEAIERNPCDAVRVKAEDSADKVKFFTPQQAATFLDYISKPYTIRTKGHTRTDDTGKQYTVGDYIRTKELPLQLKTLFTLAIYTGLRKGEILALTWDDVDFDNNTVAVTKAAAVVGGKQIVKIPKTRNSYRLVSIPRSITRQLQQLRQEQTRYRLKVGAYWQGDNWIFTQDNGTMMSYYTPYSALQDILNHYNADKSEGDKLPMIPFHGLRHTKATLQIAAGTDVRTVSAILGHRETSTTMNIYSHSLQTAEQEAANRIDELLKKQA